MKKTIEIIGVLVVAVVWGYFVDLKNGQIGWFIGRLVFMVVFYLFLSNNFSKKEK